MKSKSRRKGSTSAANGGGGGIIGLIRRALEHQAILDKQKSKRILKKGYSLKELKNQAVPVVIQNFLDKFFTIDT